jgi:hypothetical protein
MITNKDGEIPHLINSGYDPNVVGPYLPSHYLPQISIANLTRFDESKECDRLGTFF